MTSFYQRPTQPTASERPAPILLRKPVRVSATIPWQLHQDLQRRADAEGRSLSNLIANLLEMAI